MSRTVVTGLGVVSPLGCGVETFRRRLVAGESAIGAAGDLHPDAPGLAARVGEIPVRELLPAALLRRMDRLAKMMCAAGAMAAEEAGLVVRSGNDAAPLRHADRVPADDVAVVAASALGNLSETAQFLDRVFGKGPALANPMIFPNTVMNAAASELAIAFGWRGPNLTLCEGEISGEIALHAATELLERRRARAVVVIGGDELSPILVRSLREMRVLSPRRGRREWASPFDVGANGFVAGEGAAALVLEPEDTRARAWAVVTGVTRTSASDMRVGRWPRSTAPFRFAAVPDLLVLGADSAPERDRFELELARDAVAAGAPVTSIKGAVGEFGASGLLGVVAAVTAIESGVAPPLAALETPIDARARFVRTAESRPSGRAAVVGSARGGSAAVVELARGS